MENLIMNIGMGIIALFVWKLFLPDIIKNLKKFRMGER